MLRPHHDVAALRRQPETGDSAGIQSPIEHRVDRHIFAKEANKVPGELKVGLPVFTVSIVGAGTNLWGLETFPTQWGGPNIGAGMLQLLFYMGAFVGAVLMVRGIRKHRRERNGD
jgi:hypothetical protein